MTVRPIVLFPDPRLRKAADPVRTFDADLRTLSIDLLDTMRAAPGIGITAPHIGVALRVVVLDLRDASGARTYINPEIVWISDETLRHEEGSVSMPGVIEQIERPARIHVRYQDLDGHHHIEASEGLRAICHQHESDQLNGIFWTQRLSGLRRNRLVTRYEKLRRVGSRSG